MVEMLVNGLRDDPDVEILHVNPQLSDDAADVGRWRLRKPARLIAACLAALRLRRRHGRCLFYYVPAPGKRGALYRDWTVMLLCRPFFAGLVLHWHAVGLGAWLRSHATPPERWLTRLFLGRAALAVVLDPALAGDARALAPRKVAVVPNGIPDPGAPVPRPAEARPPCRVLYLGLGSRAKGLFDTVAAVVLLHRRAPGSVQLTVAGSFASQHDEEEFAQQATVLDDRVVTYVGPVDATRKHALFAQTDVFCFPTSYPYEGQPLTVIEAMAHDVGVVTTRWRGIPGMLPETGAWFVESGDPRQIAEAITAAHQHASAGVLRRHFLAHFTREHHLARLKAALLSAQPSDA
jgi:glycosyltransferase involved in cell wall biosynthesis